MAKKEDIPLLHANLSRSGVPLPDNFDKIALGAKEIAVVQRVRPEWRP